MDAFSLPQVFGTDSLDLSMEMSNQTEAASAVKSIPAYVERCDLFIVLAPDPWHNRHNFRKVRRGLFRVFFPCFPVANFGESVRHNFLIFHEFQQTRD